MITLDFVKKLGFVLSGETAWHKGYVTRKCRCESEIEVFIVPETGRTKRRRQLYYLEPAFNSTKYCRRVYLNFPPGWVADASWYENVKLHGGVDLEDQLNYPRSLTHDNGVYYSEENTCNYSAKINGGRYDC